MKQRERESELDIREYVRESECVCERVSVCERMRERGDEKGECVFEI